MASEEMMPTPPTQFYTVEINSSTWTVPTRYSDLRVIGGGSYGLVCLSNDRETNMEVAIKKLYRPFSHDLIASRAFREVFLLKRMSHENVISLVDLFTPEPDFEHFSSLYIVTPYVGPDLGRVIKEISEHLSKEHIKFFVYQILRGLKYIHSLDIIHRDLKPTNIAVSRDSDLKILDFGLARKRSCDMTDYVVARWYRAPEVIFNWCGYDQRIDVWSVGCIMAELITHEVLFDGADAMDQLQRIFDMVGSPSNELLQRMTSESAIRIIRSWPQRPKRDFKVEFSDADPEAIDLLEKMLDIDPGTRVTVEDALRHPYLRDLADPTDEPVGEPIEMPFDETIPMRGEQWKRLVYGEVCSFVPSSPSGPSS